MKIKLEYDDGRKVTYTGVLVRIVEERLIIEEMSGAMDAGVSIVEIEFRCQGAEYD